MGKTHTVRFEPVGIEIEVDEDETILNAAFRQGIMLMHGCKEGQCSACKSFLLDGEVDLDRYSTFALPDFEEAEGWTLLCRAHAYSDLEIELINYDEEMLRSGIAARARSARRASRRSRRSPHDIRRLVLSARRAARVQARPVRRHRDPRHRGRAPLVLDGQHARARRARVHDQAVPGRHVLGPARRRRDQARRRARGHRPLRRLHAARQLPAPAAVHRRRRRAWRRSSRCCARWPRRAATRAATYYYGARTEADLFHLDELAGWPLPMPVRPGPVGGRATAGAARRGLITDVVDRLEGDLAEVDAYLCGPPPMVDAAIALLERQGRARVAHLLRQVHHHRALT